MRRADSRRVRSISAPALVVMALLAGAGCRLHPVSLASMALGDAINDADVRKRQEKLVNQPVDAADQMFGTRTETWVDAADADRELITYPVELDPLKSQNWVVEVRQGRLVSLSRVKRNIDGVEDVIKAIALEPKVKGKTPEQCRQNAEFGEPLAMLRCRETNETIRVYDVRNWTNSRGARYCVLRFDAEDRCRRINMLGVSASSMKDPVTGTPRDASSGD